MLKKEFLLQNKEEVRKMFVEENHTVKEVAEAFNCSTAVLQRFMKEQGIFKRKIKKLEDLPSKIEVQELVNSGLEYSEICSKLNITVEQLGKILEIGRFSNKIDETLISEESPLTWYLLGIICSDGHNSSGDNIDIFQKDAEYLNDLKSLLGHKGSLYKSSTGYDLRINSPALTNILNKYKISSDKRYSVPYLQAPTLKLESYFIRGLFDGDGCIYYNYVSGSFQNRRMEITTGSKEMSIGLQDLYNRLGLHYTIDERVSSAGNPYYVIYVRTERDIINFGNWIYSGTFTFKLQAKYIKFLKFLRILEIDQIFDKQVDDIVDTN